MKVSPFDPREQPTIVARIAARALDYVVLGAAGGALGTVMGFGFGWLAATALLVLAYFVLADARAGTTLGKAVLGLGVEDARGRPPTVRAALVRESFVVLGALPFVGPPLALAAWITLFVTIRASAGGRGLHDRLAGDTRVVRRAR